MKRCYRCGADKPLEGFVRNKSKKDGRTSECRDCRRRMHRERRRTPQGREAHRIASRQSRTGVSGEEYREAFDRQGGLCALCDLPEDTMQGGKVTDLVVYRASSSGQVILLCRRCRTGLAMFGRDPEDFLRVKGCLIQREGAAR